MLLRYKTALKKNVCCGEIIPTNVNSQLYGTGNRSKCPPPSCTLKSVRLKENLLPFLLFHYYPFCSQRTPRFVAWVFLHPVLTVSSLCPSRFPTWSSHGEWDLVTWLAKRVDQTGIRYEGLVFARGGSKPEDGTDSVQYSILKYYCTCGDVMVHNRPHVDTAFFTLNIHLIHIYHYI